jgi:hypothetical protein
MRPWRIICLVLLAGLQQSWIGQAPILASQEPEAKPVPKDSWYRDMPAALIIDPVKKTVVEWAKVDPAEVYQVTKPTWPKAESMLAKKAITLLSTDQARQLAGKPIVVPPRKKPYLVRAVYYERGTGKYYVSVLGTYLSVNHDSLGPWPAAMKRDALVVLLDTEPNEVFVTCGRAV